MENNNNMQQTAVETTAAQAQQPQTAPAQQVAVQPAKKEFKITRMIWFVCIASFLFILFGQLIGSVVLSVISAALGITDGGTQFLFMYLCFFGIILLLLVYLAIFDRPVLKTFGYKSKPDGEGNTFAKFGLGLLVGFGMNALCILAAWLHGDIDFYVGNFDVLYMLPGIVCVCIQSGAEELITRGYMMRSIEKNYNLPLAVIINSLFFGVLHIMNPGVTPMAIINIVLIGLGFSLATVYLKSLWFAVALHTAWNYCQSLFFGLPNSGAVSEKSFLHLEAAASSSAFYDAEFGVEASWPAFAVEMALIAVFAVLLIVRHNKEKVQALPEAE